MLEKYWDVEWCSSSGEDILITNQWFWEYFVSNWRVKGSQHTKYLSIDELVGSLKAYEQQKKMMKEESIEEILQSKEINKDVNALYSQNFYWKGHGKRGIGNEPGGRDRGYKIYYEEQSNQ